MSFFWIDSDFFWGGGNMTYEFLKQYDVILEILSLYPGNMNTINTII